MNDRTSNREQIADRLRVAEDRFRVAQTAGGVGWFEWELETNEWDCTAQVALLFGFDPRTTKRSLAEWEAAIFIDDVPKLHAAADAACKTGAYYVEFRVRHMDGSVHWIAGKGEAGTDEIGRRRVTGVYFEITERKQLEARLLALNETLESRAADRARQLAATTARLEETERRFRLFIDAVTDYAIFMLDEAGYIITWNPGAARIKGYTSEEIIGQHFSRFYTDEDRRKGLPDRALATAEQTGKFETEGWRVRKDGSTFWGTILITAIRDPSGTLLGFAKITRDTTERMQAQEALRESAEMSRDIIASALDAFIQFDQRGKITEWNHRAEAIFGWSRDEVLGKELASLIVPAAQRQAYRSGLKRFIRTGEGPVIGQRVEMNGLRSDGKEISVELSVTALPRRDGYVFNGFLRDITEKKATEEQLRQSQKMEAVGQLTGGVAHDFNNLLTVIMGNLEHLQRISPREQPMQRIIAAAHRGASRAATLIEQLLAFSRRQPLAPQIVSVNNIVAGMSDLLRRTIGEEIFIETVLAGGLWPTFVDSNQLENALMNLAINARDAMPDGGKLTIETANSYLDEGYARMHKEVKTGQYVGIFVTDSGVGMPPEVAAQAFEPFFTTKETGQGTGLGLSQVYGFIKQSGGHVKIYSEVGQGTTVKLYLPRHRGAEEAKEHIPETRELPRGRSETVLIVEDDPDVREYTVEMVGDLGYQVLTAQDGHGALRLLDENPGIRLLFTDVVLPGGLNGRQLAEHAQRRRPHLKVIYTTGYARNAIVHQGRLDPGVEVVFKPFTYSDLATKIRHALDN